MTARVDLARVPWLKDFRTCGTLSRAEFEDARRAQHADSFNYALYRGDVRSRYGSEICQRRAITPTCCLTMRKGMRRGVAALRRGYPGAVAIRRGDVAAALRRQSLLEELGETGIIVRASCGLPQFMCPKLWDKLASPPMDLS